MCVEALTVRRDIVQPRSATAESQPHGGIVRDLEQHPGDADTERRHGVHPGDHHAADVVRVRWRDEEELASFRVPRRTCAAV